MDGWMAAFLLAGGLVGWLLACMVCQLFGCLVCHPGRNVKYIRYNRGAGGECVNISLWICRSLFQPSQLEYVCVCVGLCEYEIVIVFVQQTIWLLAYFILVFGDFRRLSSVLFFIVFVIVFFFLLSLNSFHFRLFRWK